MHAYCNNCNRRQFYLHKEERKNEKQRRPGSELRERKQIHNINIFENVIYLKNNRNVL